MISQRFNKSIYTITKRTFWNYREECLKVYPKVIGDVGYIFRHNNILCSYDEFTVKDLISISISKYECDTDLIINSIKNNKPMYIVTRSDLVGNPLKGIIMGPNYLKKIISNVEASKEAVSQEKMNLGIPKKSLFFELGKKY
jgi:hypothetical protein